MVLHDACHIRCVWWCGGWAFALVLAGRGGGEGVKSRNNAVDVDKISTSDKVCS